MKHSRRDTIKLGLLGSVCGGIGQIPVNVFAQSAAESARVIAQPPKWAGGLEGQRKPDLGNGYYLNPIIPGNAPDPDVVKDGNDYYMTFSSFEEYPGLPLYHSRDLVNWVRIGSAVTKPITFWAAFQLRRAKAEARMSSMQTISWDHGAILFR